MKRVLFLLTICALVIGCETKPSPLVEAATDAGMPPSEFKALIDEGAYAISQERGELSYHIGRWQERDRDGTWAERIEDGSYKEFLGESYQGDPLGFPKYRVRELEDAIKKMDAAMAYLDAHPELLEN